MNILTLKSKNQFPQEAAGESYSIIAEIRSVVTQIEAVNSLFNMTSDPDMIERYIHELYSLEAYYAFLLKQAKQNSAVCPTAMMCSKMESEV